MQPGWFGLWFTVFPIAGWSYYLLAMLMPAVALWIVWRLSADYLDVDKRIVGLALLTFVPFFNFHALKFNVNTVLLPLWAATTWFFLRSVRTRGTLWAILAGSPLRAPCLANTGRCFCWRVGAGGAARQTAGHVFPFGGTVDHDRGWVDRAGAASRLAGRSDFAPFSYAMIVHGDKPFAVTLVAALAYLAGVVRLRSPSADHRVLAMARPDVKTLVRHVVAAGDRTPARCGCVLGAAAAAGVRRGGGRHRDHLAVVDARLFAVAGAAVVVAGGDGTAKSIRAAFCLALRCLPLVMLIVSPVIAICSASRRAGAGVGAGIDFWQARSSGFGTSRRRSLCDLSAAMPISLMAWPPMRPIVRAP